MPYRRIVFAPNEVYHILNRGVAGLPIFNTDRKHSRFMELVDYYRFDTSLSFSHFNRLEKEKRTEFLQNMKSDNKKLIEIYAFCLIPNHFHFLVKQLEERGIPKFLSNIQNAYARFYNLRNERKGPLFEAMFKGVRIENDEQLLHVSRYIHLNPSSSFLVEIGNLDTYEWSSLPVYLDKTDSDLVNKDFVLKIFGNKNKYKDFVYNQAEYQRSLEKMKHLTLG